MIERMKEVLYQESEDKTVIVVTHNPYFLDARSIENTFIFFYRKMFRVCQKHRGPIEIQPCSKIH